MAARMDISSLLNVGGSLAPHKTILTAPEASHFEAPRLPLRYTENGVSTQLVERQKKAPSQPSLMWVDTNIKSIIAKRSLQTSTTKAHVMRTYARQKKRTDIERLKKPVGRGPASYTPSSHSKDSATCIECGKPHSICACTHIDANAVVIELIPQKRVSTNPRNMLLSSNIDPFNSTGYPLSMSMSEFMRFYVSVMLPQGEEMLPKWKPVGDSRRELLQVPTILSSAPLLYVVSSLCSLVQHFTAGWSVDQDRVQRAKQAWKMGTLVDNSLPEYFNLKLKGVSLINKALDDPSSRFDEAVLRALEFLCRIELHLRDEEELKQHFQDLQKLVELRGGSQSAMSFEMCLVDVPYAGNHFAKPLLPPVIFDDAEELLWEDAVLEVFTCTMPTERAFHSELSQVVHTDVLAIYTELRILTLLRKMHHMDKDFVLTPEYEYLYLKRTYAIDHSILLFPYVTPGYIESALERCVRLACLIFTESTIFKDEPLKRSRLSYLHSYLIGTMMTMDLKKHWAETPNLLFWILAMGTYSATDRPERPWFVKNLADGIVRLGVKGCDDAENISLQFLFLEYLHTPDFVEIGNEVWAYLGTTRVGKGEGKPEQEANRPLEIGWQEANGSMHASSHTVTVSKAEC